MKFRLAALLVLVAVWAGAHDVVTTKVTWTREISRIVYRRCVVCHAPGGRAFALTTYAQVRPWAKAIQEETGKRRMPPWQAVKGFGEFRNDHGLTQEEIELMGDWAEGGAPEGDARYLPPKPRGLSWLEPVIPAGTRGIEVRSGFRLNSSARLVAIRPGNVAGGKSLQVIAILPGGAITPLLWLYQYDPKFRRSYYYRTALPLPAGSRIEVGGSGMDSFLLFVSSR